jgi:hypothetical protein
VTAERCLKRAAFLVDGNADRTGCEFHALRSRRRARKVVMFACDLIKLKIS